MGKNNKSKSNKMTILDAVDNLSNMAEIDIEIEKEERSMGVKKALHTFKTLKSDEKENTLSTVKGTFKTIHKYLEHIYHKDKEELKDIDVQRGVKAIMILADEAADKLGKCTTLFKHTYKEGKVYEIKEYKDLCSFFKKKIIKRFQEVLASEANWEEEWGVDDENINIEKLGLRDLETVKRDKEYELFYIRKDDGRPFFNRNLLRHIKLVSDFDEIISTVEGDDPLVKINAMLDHDAQGVAENIKEDVKNELGDFYIHALQHKEVPIVGEVIKLTMSLMLACNPKNLVDHTMGKVCTRYQNDFHGFLRKILESTEYNRLISYSIKEIDQLSQTLIYLIHAYAYAFFTRRGNQKQFQKYYENLINLGYKEDRSPKRKSAEMFQFFSDIFDDYDIVTNILKKYPNGPLFKTLDIFKDRDKEEGFDPIIQGNYPYQIYRFSSEAFDAKCLNLPCPTLHTHINKATVIAEFKGFLRHIETKKEINKHLIINLQDRISWEEHARCQVIEEMENIAEFHHNLVVVTFPKKSDFYYQIDTYLNNNSANDFMQIFAEQIISGEECGYYFSSKIDKENINKFIKKILPITHLHFFSKKEKLERNERLDFIEIIYMFLYLNILDQIRPDLFSFTCKDGVDISATTNGGFIALLNMLGKKSSWNEQEQEHMNWVLNGPALFVRERLVHYQRLSRILSALGTLYEGFHKDKSTIFKDLSLIYNPDFLQKIQYIIV